MLIKTSKTERVKRKDPKYYKSAERQAAYRQKVESSASFKQVQQQMTEAAASARAQKKADLENNAEYQKNKARTKEQRTRDAIELSAKGIQENREWKGTPVSYEEARKVAEGYAQRTETDKE